MIQPPNKTPIQSKLLLWLILLCYVSITTYMVLHHEPWGDELHSWNIAKGSDSYTQLISNIRYEGHPPAWHTVLWSISKLTHNFLWVQLFHLTMAVLIVYVILFYAPYRLSTKIFLPLGYYFLFEYAILSRNYVMGVLAAFLICIVLKRNIKYKYLVYYTLLFIMSNTHLLAAILAGCLHLYFLLGLKDKKFSMKKILLHVTFGALILLPSLYFIWPPSDSELGADKWLQRWNASRMALDFQAPLRAFIPIPAWWELHFWNEQFLLALHTRYGVLKFMYPVIVLALIGLACYTLKGSKKALTLFIANLLLTYIIGNVMALGTQRYTGFIFISFLVAYWLANEEKALQRASTILLNSMLVMQMIAGLFATIKDISLPFSNFYRVKELMNQVPANNKVVTDYWALIAVTTYTEKPIYSIDTQETIPFSLWKNDMLRMRLTPYRYYNGFSHLRNEEHLHNIYLLSTTEPKQLAAIDCRLFTNFNVKLVDKRDGAIEKSSNLYLYQITPLQ